MKIHPWFNSVHWRRLEAGRVKPPFEPDPHAVYAKVGQAGAVAGLEITIVCLSRMFWISSSSPP